MLWLTAPDTQANGVPAPLQPMPQPPMGISVHWFLTFLVSLGVWALLKS